MSSLFVLEKKMVERATAVVASGLRPGETIDLVTRAQVGPSQAGTNLAMGTLSLALGVLVGSTAFGHAGRRIVFPILTSQRMIFLEASKTAQPVAEIVAEVPRAELRASAPRGIWNRVVALDSATGERFVELHYLFAQKGDAGAMAKALA